MTHRPPFTVSGSDWETGLWWMVLASLGLHLFAIIGLLLVPHSFLHQPQPLHSYTVDLVAPDKLGGTNMVQGGKGRVEAPPLAAAPAPKVEPPKPPPPKVEEAKAPEPPPPPPKPVEVAKPEPKPPPPKPEEKPKEAEPPKENEVALAEKAKKVEPPPAPTVAKAEPAKPPPPSKAEVKAAEAKAAEAKAAKAAEAKAAKEAAAAHERDERIAAAVKHAERQVGERGGGSGQKSGEQSGGPISVGPGEGAGGTVKGVEYLLYYNQMINRIKQIWAWAGSNDALEAAVRFNVSETGEVFNVRIARSSGDGSYDASVERAVRAANPLPPPPESYRKEFSDVELTFRPPEQQQ